MKLTPYMRQLRPANWLKNVFVFVPVVFAGELMNVGKLTSTFIVFVAFCMVSSSVYVFNDMHDIKADRVHPIKRSRPLASGEIGVTPAVLLAGILLAASILLSFCMNYTVMLIIVLYFIENILYSVFLKRMPIFDCFCVAAGFVLRIYAGGYASELLVSDWLFLTIVVMSLFMAFGKRRGEMIKIEKTKQREVLGHYDLMYLNGMVFICSGLSVVFYALWAMDRGRNMIYTVPVIIFIVFRYLLLVYSEESYGDPTTVIFSDKTLLALCTFYGVFVVCFF
jgi:4-hydroxybenzoate polyprenyltransferase